MFAFVYRAARLALNFNFEVAVSPFRVMLLILATVALVMLPFMPWFEDVLTFVVIFILAAFFLEHPEQTHPRSNS
jgi:hypothetical protein